MQLANEGRVGNSAKKIDPAPPSKSNSEENEVYEIMVYGVKRPIIGKILSMEVVPSLENPEVHSLLVDLFDGENVHHIRSEFIMSWTKLNFQNAA